MHKIFKIIALVLGVLGLLLYFISFADTPEELKENSKVNIFIILAYLTLLVTVVPVLFFSVKNLMNNKEALRKTLISLGIFAGIVLLSYLFADSTEVLSPTKEVIGTSGVSKLVSTGLNTTFALAIIAIATMVWSGFTKIKK